MPAPDRFAVTVDILVLHRLSMGLRFCVSNGLGRLSQVVGRCPVDLLIKVKIYRKQPCASSLRKQG